MSDSLIKVNYYINDEESSVTFDPNNKISVLKNIISLSLKVDLNDYEIVYNRKKLGRNDDRILREITGNDRAPVFIIRKRNLNKKFEMEENKISDQLNNKIVVGNYPSISEIYNLLNNFLKTRNYSSVYKADHVGNSIQFSFSNPDIAYEFMKQLNYEKINSSIYSKVKTTLLLDTFSREDERVFTGNNLNKSADNPLNKNLNASLISKHLNKSHNYNEIKSLNDNIIYRFYENQKYVRNSAPYFTYEELRKKEEKENRKKWISKNGFINSVGKHTSSKPNYIPNFVNLTPSEPPVNYNFREIKKTKWVNGKGFL